MADINTPEIDMLNAVDRDSDKKGKKINPVPRPEINIGLDVSDAFWDAVEEASDASAIDIGAINNFSQVSQNRETLYQVYDTMSEDPLMAAALEVYTEDATEPNDVGDVVWAESSDATIGRYVSFLLDSLNVDKHIYKWTYSLIKYGDLYLRLYRNSDFNDDLLGDDQKTKLNERFSHLTDADEPDTLNEEAKMMLYRKDDHFANYIEAVPNPAEMFELTKFGKSYAYIKTNNLPKMVKQDDLISNAKLYKFRRKDIEIYNAVSFAHAYLQDDVSRSPEQVEIFLNNDLDSSESNAYTVN